MPKEVTPILPTAASLGPTANRSEPTSIPGLSSDRTDRQLQTELNRVDPVRDGWKSEAFSERALTQLHRLGDAIASRGAPSTQLVADVIAPSFSTSELRPEPLSQVFTDGHVTARRWPAKQNAVTDGLKHAGPGGLDRACERLLTGIGDRVPIRVAFKIVHVKLDGLSAKCEVHYSLAALGPEERTQQKAIWECDWIPVADGRPLLKSIEVTEFEEVNSHGQQVGFVDYTQSVFLNQPSFRTQLAFGLDHWRDRIDWRFGWEVVGAHGLAVGDVDGDGKEDLYVCETGGLPNRLLLQQDDGSVRDASSVSGVDFLEPTHSALLLDLDNDGDQDLVVAIGVFVLAFENDGRAQFAQRYVNNHRSIVRSLAAADYDGNGLIDIYVCGYATRDAQLDSVGLGRPVPYHDANNGAANYLLANQGDWKFDDVTTRIGLDENNRRFSYAAAWEDYDNDGDLDIYVANDFGRNNLYRNDQLHFTDVAAQAGVEDVAAGMSVSWGDYNRDGLPDLYIGNMFSSAGHRIAYQRQFKSNEDTATRELYQRHARGNSLFENAGDGTFRDVSRQAAVTEGRWAWSSNFVDINNDGWEDLIVANGMITGTEDSGDL